MTTVPNRRQFTAVIASVAALCCAIALTAPASAATWRFETLDGASNGPNGRIDALTGISNTAVVWNNQPHVFYVTVGGTQDLRHAWWTGSAWFFETLDGVGGANGRANINVGRTTSATVWNNQPHVWYHDTTNQSLRHAWWNGNAWYFENLDGRTSPGGNGRTSEFVGEFSTATVWNALPHIWYRANGIGDLRHAWWSGTAWSFETLDGDCVSSCADGSVGNDVGYFGAAAVWNGTPHVWYQNGDTQDLRHAWWTGNAWLFETLDGACDGACTDGRVDAAISSSIAPTVWNKWPHVFYQDIDSGNLRHGWWTGSGWQFEVLDGEGGADGRLDSYSGATSATALLNGQPHIWYFDNSFTNLRHAWWTGTAWNFETLDGEGGTDGRVDGAVGGDATAVVWNKRPHIFYLDDANIDLRHAWYR